MKKYYYLFLILFTISLSYTLVSCGGDDEDDELSINKDGYGRFDNPGIFLTINYDTGDHPTFTFNSNGTYSSTDMPFLESGIWRKSTDEKFINFFKYGFGGQFNNDQTEFLCFEGSGYKYNVVLEKDISYNTFRFYLADSYSVDDMTFTIYTFFGR